MSVRAKPDNVNLLDIVKDTYNGDIVLPDFQRDFVWGASEIQELLESILSDYFIGSLLFLDSASDKPPFPTRLIAGVEEINPIVVNQHVLPKKIVLDGQQRITSLFYAIREPPLHLKGGRNPHKFFVDIEKLIATGPEDAVVSVSTHSPRELEKVRQMVVSGKMLPFSQFADSTYTYRWLWSSQTAFGAEKNKQEIQRYMEQFYSYLVPVVSISPQIGLEAIVDTFERINRTGTRLSVFDLAVAQLYPNKIKLRELWQEFEESAASSLGLPVEDIGKVVEQEYLLKVITLVNGKGCKKSALLKLGEILNVTQDPAKFQTAWNESSKAIVDALRRMREIYGVINLRNDIPYRWMVVPLAALLIKVAEFGGYKALYDKVDRWYWNSVFLERYEKSVDTQAESDFREMLKGFSEPKGVEWGNTFDQQTFTVIYLTQAHSYGILSAWEVLGFSFSWATRSASLTTFLGKSFLIASLSGIAVILGFLRGIDRSPPMAKTENMNLVKLVDLFHSEDNCRAYLEELRWPEGVACPRCDHTSITSIEDRGQYSCNKCAYHFSVTSSTIMHDTHLPLWKWFLATYTMSESKKGVSANQLKRMLGVSYKTAWYLCHRIRAAMTEVNAAKLIGTVEVDETFVGGVRRGVGSGSKEGKTLVIGALERDGDIRLQVIDDRTRRTLHQFIRDHVADRAERIITDEWAAYKGIGDKDTKHETVNHAQGEYVRGDVYTNSVENVWSLLKRSIVGSFHHVSEKHLDAYLDELEWRFNNRDNPYLFRDTLSKLISSERLEYKELTG